MLSFAPKKEFCASKGLETPKQEGIHAEWTMAGGGKEDLIFLSSNLLLI